MTNTTKINILNNFAFEKKSEKKKIKAFLYCEAVKGWQFENNVCIVYRKNDGGDDNDEVNNNNDDDDDDNTQ